MHESISIETAENGYIVCPQTDMIGVKPETHVFETFDALVAFLAVRIGGANKPEKPLEMPPPDKKGPVTATQIPVEPKPENTAGVSQKAANPAGKFCIFCESFDCPIPGVL